MAAGTPIECRVKPRFTLDGSDALEARLDRLCRRIVVSVRRVVSDSRIEAILLGGGYGRGEGGVLKTPDGDRAYNDFELYVCLGGNTWTNERRHRQALHDLGVALSSEAGMDVEFKITSLKRLQHGPTTMFYHDLVMGHRVLWGEPGCLAQCGHHQEAAAIPLHEATRLMMNRCSGLLFAAERLGRRPFTSQDADFAGRNLAKAQLGYADAVLAARGRYHWSCRERHARVCALELDQPWWPEAQRHHAEGLAFKLHPQRRSLPVDVFTEQHAALSSLGWHIWSWLEGRRLAANPPFFPTSRAYALSPLDKCPETHPLRNVLVNLKAFGPRAMFRRGVTRYPRQRLLHSLALLLWERSTLADALLLKCVQRELATRARTFPELVRAYEAVWKRFN